MQLRSLTFFSVAQRREFSLSQFVQRRDVMWFLAGVFVGGFIWPLTVFAQTTGVAATAIPGSIPVTDQGTAAAVTKFLTDLGRRIYGGEKAAPEWFPIVLASILAPIIVAALAMAAGINIANPPMIAGIFISGILVAGGAVLLTAGHAVSRAADANVPASLASVSRVERAQLCCLHGDCRTVQMAGVQVASGQPAVPVEAATPVPMSPPAPPPADPPIGPGVGVMPPSPIQSRPKPWEQKR